MDRLVRLVSLASVTRGNDYDDFADRLSSRYTVVILVAFAVLVGMNQYVRQPITCWTPNHFSGAHSRYTVRYCWIRNTYYLPWSTDFPPVSGHKALGRRMVPYYQWIPFILLTQAVLFYAPTIIWRAFNSKSGVDADSIMEVSQSVARASQPQARDATLRTLTKHFDRFLGSRRDVIQHHRGCRPSARCLLSAVACGLCGRRMTGYLLVLYIVSKLFYIANVIGQLFVLNRVLGMTYNTFGIDMVKNFADAKTSGRDWTEDQSYVAFPRVTLCDMKVRGQDLGNVQPYTVQCVLPVNAYNEKIYVFLWFWMVFVAFCSCLSLLLWLLRAIAASDRRRFIENHLQMGDRVQQPMGTRDDELANKFSRDYLRQDGALLLRLIAHNTDSITTTELVCALWDAWKDNYVDSVSNPPVTGTNNVRHRLYPEPSELNGLQTSLRKEKL